MGKISLQIKANLENITNLQTSGDDFRWYFKIKCMNCGEVPDKWQYLILTEEMPLKGSRGSANYVGKCKLCSRTNSASILKDSLVSYTAEDNETFKTFAQLDCRGIEPVDFSPRIGFTAEGSESGTKFTDINLQEKEWVEYDEKAQVSVGIYELEHRFMTA